MKKVMRLNLITFLLGKYNFHLLLWINRGIFNVIGDMKYFEIYLLSEVNFCKKILINASIVFYTVLCYYQYIS